MGPAEWGIVFLVLCTLVSLIAKKKGRSAVTFFLAMALPAIPLMLLVSWGLGDAMEKKPFAMWLAAFICPTIGFFAALMADNKEQLAVKEGEYADMRKCPFCAESVRKEAVKCKHCHSELAVSA